MLDEEIEISKSRSPMKKGLTYDHPCFGRIKINHIQGDTRLFGSEISTRNPVSITVSSCEVTQDLGRNWYFSKDEIVEAWLTPVQYAELISSPNTEGVPCTIVYTESKGRIKSKHIDSGTEFARNELDNRASDIKTRAKTLVKEVEQLLTGSVKKADKEDIVRLVHRMATDIGSNFEFHEECVKENIEKCVLEAKTEIDHHITRAVNRLGVKALESPEAIKLILGSEPENELKRLEE